MTRARLFETTISLISYKLGKYSVDTAKVCLVFAEENINDGLYTTTTFSLGSYISKLANQELNN